MMAGEIARQARSGACLIAAIPVGAARGSGQTTAAGGRARLPPLALACPRRITGARTASVGIVLADGCNTGVRGGRTSLAGSRAVAVLTARARSEARRRATNGAGPGVCPAAVVAQVRSRIAGPGLASRLSRAIRVGAASAPRNADRGGRTLLHARAAVEVTRRTVARRGGASGRFARITRGAAGVDRVVLHTGARAHVLGGCASHHSPSGSTGTGTKSPRAGPRTARGRRRSATSDRRASRAGCCASRPRTGRRTARPLSRARSAASHPSAAGPRRRNCDPPPGP